MDAPLVALTFDDGPGTSTERLLDVLARHGARATFFLLGRHLQGQALAVAARAAREGHLLGNHTMTHARELAPDLLLAEVAACDALVDGCYAGADHPPIPVRLPFGISRPDAVRSLETLERLGRPHCHWTGDPQDWRPDRTAPQLADAMSAHIEKAWHHRRDPIVLLHDASDDGTTVLRDTTVDAVDELCARLAHARFVTLLECDPRRYRLPAGGGFARALAPPGS
jgi:peptidoglycan/xylan/chitin deacetylase (PgdA/CDA1 family)